MTVIFESCLVQTEDNELNRKERNELSLEASARTYMCLPIYRISTDSIAISSDGSFICFSPFSCLSGMFSF